MRKGNGRMTTGQQEATVADLWNIQGWNLIFRRPLNDWETENLDLSTVEDSFRRGGERQGNFTVKSAYKERNTSNLHLVASQRISAHPGKPCDFTIVENVSQLQGISWAMPRNIVNVLASWNREGANSNQKERWKVIPACIWWAIWEDRNKKCFEDKSSHFQKIKLKCFIFLV
ncbi:hypothetical protein H5410_008278 [Solanum commersonii]|uniref:Uncharacterized protein n=1 Tax=Solanum commersonii TaxID=4109 RepID=A0A9J6AFK5_SOLCO|nr:hypothetical protein H5410_008278 [Solanum commersonii]